MALDVVVVIWSSTWQLRTDYECVSNFVPSAVLVLIMIGLPTVYALWRGGLHLRAEPDRRAVIRGVMTVIAVVGVASVVGGIIVLSVSNALGNGRC